MHKNNGFISRERMKSPFFKNSNCKLLFDFFDTKRSMKIIIGKFQKLKFQCKFQLISISCIGLCKMLKFLAKRFLQTVYFTGLLWLWLLWLAFIKHSKFIGIYYVPVIDYSYIEVVIFLYLCLYFLRTITTNKML